MSNIPLTWIGERSRAKRSDVIDAQQWNRFKDVLQHCYDDREMSMQDVIDHMLEHHGFNATGRQYRRQFDKWEWPRRRPRRERPLHTTVTAGANHIPSHYTPTKHQSSGTPIVPDVPALVWSSTVSVDVAQRENRRTDEAFVPQQDQNYDKLFETDTSERCSLRTYSSSLSSRTSRRGPSTPDLLEPILPHSGIGLLVKTPSRNAFRPETPEYHPLTEISEHEDIYEILPVLPQTADLLEQGRKLSHRKSSIIGCYLTTCTGLVKEDLVSQPITHQNDVISRSSQHTFKQSFLSLDLEEEEDVNENEDEDGGSLDARHGISESRLIDTFYQIDGQLGTIQEDVDPEAALFPHKHDLGVCPPGICCWPQAAATILERCSTDAAFQVDLESITSTERCLTNVVLPSTTPKGTAILGTIMDIASKIDQNAIGPGDVTKLIRMADFFTAARMYDDSFALSQITWELLSKRCDTTLSVEAVCYTGTPAWLSSLINMLRSCTGPEHLQLSAAVFKDVPIFNSFSADKSHPSMALLYAFLGETLQRLSGSEIADDAAVGCWTLIPKTLLSPPNYLLRQVVASAVEASVSRTDAASIPEATYNRLAEFHLPASTKQRDDVITSSLEMCVRNVLVWVRQVLNHLSFSNTIETIDESFWSPPASPLDILRFERLAVFAHLCQSLWLHEHLEHRADPMRTEDVDVLNALQTITACTGLARESIIAAVLGIAKPIPMPIQPPRRCDMSRRFCQGIEKLYNATAMGAAGFDHVGRTMDIHDLMERCSWAGNSTCSLEEFDDIRYARKVGIFLREQASSGIGLPGSEPLQPMLVNLHHGDGFLPQTLLASTRSSQMSMDTRSLRSMAKRLRGKTLRGSSSSWNLRGGDSQESVFESLGFRRSSKHSSSLRNGLRTSSSVNSLRESFHTLMSLDSDRGKHTSTSSNDLMRSSIMEENERD